MKQPPDDMKERFGAATRQGARLKRSAVGLSIRPDAQEAFNDAIAGGRLSLDPRSNVYALNYMYMYTDDQRRDQFKHKETRNYLPNEATGKVRRRNRHS